MTWLCFCCERPLSGPLLWPSTECARSSQPGFVGGEQLLLTLLRRQGTLATAALERAGLRLEKARAPLHRLRRDESHPAAGL
ncbi:Clp protease N-terminal domain-containing protein [Thermogemmatispora sp.]|uniref:Clp protease N-terminal domain-containing protein n=1 Tax=Thermogemmatispora sp. TaxID=1968838 RepID=UPI0035E432A5